MALPAELSRGEETDHGERSGRERRESERAIAYWQQKREEFGDGLTLASLDLPQPNHPDWAHRFVISVAPIIQRSSFVVYGQQFARLLHLPEYANPTVPMMRQLSGRYANLFLRGCTDSQKASAPVRLEGGLPRSEDRLEQYRAAFMPIAIGPNWLTYFAFGAFNSRILDPTTSVA